MELIHLNLDQLHPAKVNARKKGSKQVADLLPSIRSLGVLQPLLVRPTARGKEAGRPTGKGKSGEEAGRPTGTKENRFEIVAGQRRYHALCALAQEGAIDSVPCIVMKEGDDARAIEASLAENVARLPMDEIDQYKAFADLAKEDVPVDEIASRFGVTERLVTQRLAIANIIEPILNAYRREEIRADTLRVLTMATKRQQKEWWKLFKEEEAYTPQGHHLRQWLFGGQQIPVINALFDVNAYQGAIISDLFGEERYFDNAESFWSLQNEAIAKLKEEYLAEGWRQVEVLDVGDFFATWNHRTTPREEGGRVYLQIAHDGEVTAHEGYVSAREARKRDTAQSGQENGEASNERPELTRAMQNYLDLHRHAVVRVDLLSNHQLALRLATAQIIAGSMLWDVKPEPQRAHNDAIAASLAENTAQQQFETERQIICELIGEKREDGAKLCDPSPFGGPNVGDIFVRLVRLDDETVRRIFTFVTAETLPCGGFLTEALGQLLQSDMARHWQPEETFFDLWRDKEAINAAIKQIAGKKVADANVTATAKVQKQIICDCLNGTRKPIKENWLPDYMDFPMTGYTRRGGIEAIEQGKKTKAALKSA